MSREIDFTKYLKEISLSMIEDGSSYDKQIKAIEWQFDRFGLTNEQMAQLLSEVNGKATQYITQYANSSALELMKLDENKELLDAEVALKKQELLLEQFRIVIESSLNIIYKQEKLNIEQQLRHESEKKLILQSKIISLNELITNISHQWRQPLSSISSAAANIDLRIELGEEVNNKDIMRFSNFVSSESQYLSSVIDDFSKTFNNVKEIHNISLKDIFFKVEKEFKVLFEQNAIEYIQNIEEDIYIYANESILTNVFYSIYNNAIEAFIAQENSEENRYFFIHISKTDEKIVIKLKDSGGGIKDKIINKIFEPYFSTKFQARGIGISLYLVYQVVINHLEGSIKIDNVEYLYKNKKLKGAEVVIELPLEYS